MIELFWRVYTVLVSILNVFGLLIVLAASFVVAYGLSGGAPLGQVVQFAVLIIFPLCLVVYLVLMGFMNFTVIVARRLKEISEKLSKDQ